MKLTLTIALAGALLATTPAYADKDMADKGMAEGKHAAKAAGSEQHHGQNSAGHAMKGPHGMMAMHAMMGRHGMKGPHAKRGGRGLMATFDTNGDGRLTQAEIDKSRGDRLAKFDADGNGSLNLAEYQALWLAAMRERMVDRFQDLDADGDAVVTAEEFKQPYANLVSNMDRNGDGVLTRQHGMKKERNKE
jgi:hypothetical protein